MVFKLSSNDQSFVLFFAPPKGISHRILAYKSDLVQGKKEMSKSNVP